MTPSPDVRKVLLTVAAREGEHGMSFAKRINELGYEVRRKDDGRLKDAMELVTSDRSDLKKMEKLKLNTLDTGDKPDIFDGLFKDHSIDIRTGELLGRYIAEERDTARLLRSCYEQLAAADSRIGQACVGCTDLVGDESRTRCAVLPSRKSCARSFAQATSSNGAPANGQELAGRNS